MDAIPPSRGFFCYFEKWMYSIALKVSVPVHSSLAQIVDMLTIYVFMVLTLPWERQNYMQIWRFEYFVRSISISSWA